MNIYQKVNEVRKLVTYIQKDKKVDTYMAVTHDAVTALVREHFIAQGIVFVPTILASSTVLTGTQTSRGTPFIRYEARYQFDVVNADEPADCFALVIEAHAIDQGDKAPGKALSYAKKYAVLKLLEIESGEGEEERQEQHKPKTVAADVFAALPPDRRNIVIDTATQVVDYLLEGKPFDAYSLCETITDPEEKIALWSRLDSKQRAAIKAQAKGPR